MLIAKNYNTTICDIMNENTTTEHHILPQGILIALEGIDGSGKTSVATFLSDYFKQLGFAVVSTRQPGATELGKHIRSMVHDRPFDVCSKAEFLLFAADRAQHIESVIKPALNAGSIVISDRMADSSIAYQGAGRGLDEHMLSQINSWAMDEIKPDVTVYIRVDWATAMYRLKKRNEKLTAFEQEKTEFFENVIRQYDAMYFNRKDVVIINGTQKPEEVNNQALQAIVALLAEHTTAHTCC